jgi:pyruvate dehydrogenase E2 component (dihydrolipoamide acetyltransferase)
LAVDIVMPRLSDSMQEGTILRWLVSEGDAVTEGQPLVEVETDKANVTYEAEHDGTVLSIAAAVGDSIAVGAVIAVVGDAAPTRVRASPLARRIAAQAGVDLAALAGSGPQGRVIRADVERARAGNGRGPRDTPSDTTPVRPAAPADGPDAGPSPVTREPLTPTQRTIARRMSESRATVPDFELRCEVDMSRVVDLREELRAVTPADALPSYNDFLVKAAALALDEFPRVNAAYVDGAFQTFDRVNVGIAVAGHDALVVPVIAGADALALGQIAATSRRLAARVRDGSITPAELSGGTFTVSNLGMYGVDSFSAVINPPQAAILAAGSLKPRPIVDEGGRLVARPTIQLTLACDHRILYGADGARFLARVRELLEKPVALML